MAGADCAAPAQTDLSMDDLDLILKVVRDGQSQSSQFRLKRTTKVRIYLRSEK